MAKLGVKCSLFSKTKIVLVHQSPRHITCDLFLRRRVLYQILHQSVLRTAILPCLEIYNSKLTQNSCSWSPIGLVCMYRCLDGDFREAFKDGFHVTVGGFLLLRNKEPGKKLAGRRGAIYAPSVLLIHNRNVRGLEGSCLAETLVSRSCKAKFRLFGCNIVKKLNQAKLSE